jgi:hypothetical protein
MSSPRQDLNLRQPLYKSGALPAELQGRKVVSVHHPQETLPAIFTALEGSDKRKHQTLFFLSSGTHQMGWETLEILPPKFVQHFQFERTYALPTPQPGFEPGTK